MQARITKTHYDKTLHTQYFSKASLHKKEHNFKFYFLHKHNRRVSEFKENFLWSYKFRTALSSTTRGRQRFEISKYSRSQMSKLWFMCPPPPFLKKEDICTWKIKRLCLLKKHSLFFFAILFYYTSPKLILFSFSLFYGRTAYNYGHTEYKKWWICKRLNCHSIEYVIFLCNIWRYKTRKKNDDFEKIISWWN